MSKTRNASDSEIAFLGDPGQPSAEIVRVEGGECRRNISLAFLGGRGQPSAEIVRVEGVE